MKTLDSLIALADQLDNAGHKKAADVVDRIVIRAARRLTNVDMKMMLNEIIMAANRFSQDLGDTDRYDENYRGRGEEDDWLKLRKIRDELVDMLGDRHEQIIDVGDKIIEAARNEDFDDLTKLWDKPLDLEDTDESVPVRRQMTQIPEESEILTPLEDPYEKPEDVAREERSMEGAEGGWGTPLDRLKQEPGIDRHDMHRARGKELKRRHELMKLRKMLKDVEDMDEEEGRIKEQGWMDAEEDEPKQESAPQEIYPAAKSFEDEPDDEDNRSEEEKLQDNLRELEDEADAEAKFEAGMNNADDKPLTYWPSNPKAYREWLKKRPHIENRVDKAFRRWKELTRPYKDDPKALTQEVYDDLYDQVMTAFSLSMAEENEFDAKEAAWLSSMAPRSNAADDDPFDAQLLQDEPGDEPYKGLSLKKLLRERPSYSGQDKMSDEALEEIRIKENKKELLRDEINDYIDSMLMSQGGDFPDPDMEREEEMLRLKIEEAAEDGWLDEDYARKLNDSLDTMKSLHENENAANDGLIDALKDAADKAPDALKKVLTLVKENPELMQLALQLL